MDTHPQHWHPSLTAEGTTHDHPGGDQYHFHLADIVAFGKAGKLTPEAVEAAKASPWLHEKQTVRIVGWQFPVGSKEWWDAQEAARPGGTR